MELVYLWVEKYKNIKNQGFNFSPRFECKFFDEYETDENGKEKLKDNCKLEINPKKHKSIFPDNINITAIVGENGSGKSRLFEIIRNTFKNKILFNRDNKSFIIVKINNKIYQVNNAFGKINIPTNSIQIDEVIEGKKFKKFFLSDEFFIPESGYEKYKNDNISYFSQRFQDLLQLDKSFFNFLNKEYVFNKYQFTLDISQNINMKDLGIDEEGVYSVLSEDGIRYGQKPWHKFIIKILYFYMNKIEDNAEFSNEIEMKIWNQDFSFELIQEILQNQVFQTPTNIFSIDNIKSIMKWKMQYSDIFQSNIFSISEGIEKKLSNGLLKYLYEEGFLNCNFFNNNSKYNFTTLSSGEKEYIKYFTYNSHNLYRRRSFKNIVFLFDEIDNTFNPKWQKAIINDSMKWLEKMEQLINFDVHLLFTSHSPFILSDLPKENVIFLEKGIQKYPFKDKQTFGANIHTLLSDGFFMSDGLMGEFAKGRIEEIKKFYERFKRFEDKEKSKIKLKRLHKQQRIKLKKTYKRNKVKFEHIQSIIGEPFLQTVIKNYLDELELIFSSDKNRIDSEIKQLEAKINKLKNLKK